MTETEPRGDFVYTVYDALADGTFVSVFENTWPMLRGGKPSVATRTLVDGVGEAALIKVYEEFAAQGLDDKPGRRRYQTAIGSRDVCVALDGEQLTMFYADED
jgi:hypothetical protein